MQGEFQEKILCVLKSKPHVERVVHPFQEENFKEKIIWHVRKPQCRQSCPKDKHSQ